uniref:27-kDa protein n=1 Tax=Babesia gibsoni TaxID=33632 RepID=C7T0Y5_BABGI|nr:27-kDa protein [Babesia gibsoni]ACV49808.1 27-kDa protein [Babesia gibsoni]ACV49809.1 27-kDa protein [Babesia gibsoni]
MDHKSFRYLLLKSPSSEGVAGRQAMTRAIAGIGGAIVKVPDVIPGQGEVLIKVAMDTDISNVLAYSCREVNADGTRTDLSGKSDGSSGRRDSDGKKVKDSPKQDLPRKPPANDTKPPAPKVDRPPVPKDDKAPTANDSKPPAANDTKPPAPKVDRPPVANDTKPPAPKVDRPPVPKDDKAPTANDSKPPAAKDDKVPGAKEDKAPAVKDDKVPGAEKKVDGKAAGQAKDGKKGDALAKEAEKSTSHLVPQVCEM